MRQLKTAVIVFLILTVFSIPVNAAGGEPAGRSGDTVTFAMCRPLVSQIKNIEQMYEKDIITLENIHLICVYHEDESTDYEPAKAYVKENKLVWVTFTPIKGKVAPGDLFKENEWTGQFRSIFDQTAGIIFTSIPRFASTILRMSPPRATLASRRSCASSSPSPIASRVCR